VKLCSFFNFIYFKLLYAIKTKLGPSVRWINSVWLKQLFIVTNIITKSLRLDKLNINKWCSTSQNFYATRCNTFYDETLTKWQNHLQYYNRVLGKRQIIMYVQHNTSNVKKWGRLHYFVFSHQTTSITCKNPNLYIYAVYNIEYNWNHCILLHREPLLPYSPLSNELSLFWIPGLSNLQLNHILNSRNWIVLLASYKESPSIMNLETGIQLNSCE
jgi:hypothetical protein